MSGIIERIKDWNWLYASYHELRVLKSNRKALWNEAVRSFEEDQPEHGSLRDYKKTMRRHRFSYKEYYTYELWRLNEQERSKYLSELELKCIYRKINDMDQSRWLNNKLMMHEKFKKYMHRDWLCPSLATFDSFCQFINTKDCIIKPWKGSLGRRIFMVQKGDDVNLQELYDKCRNECLFVEERVKGCKEMEDFHPRSLNTVRVMSISQGDRFEVVGCMFRMGAGDNVVDNGSAGGILAPVDSETGVVTGDGRGKYGTVYVAHPDTGKVIKGTVIPYWDKVIAACKEMTSDIPKAFFAGWDIGVLENGEIELIEVNAASNVMGLQTSHGCGLRPRFQAIGKEVLGFDVMRLVPVFSRPLANYKEKMRYKKFYRDANHLLEEYVEKCVKST